MVLTMTLKGTLTSVSHALKKRSTINHFQEREEKVYRATRACHSDVCGELNVKSLGGAKYFLTLVDDNTRYVWICISKHKSEVFDKFLEWKALVENSSGHMLKALHTNSGGEYVSSKIKNFLKKEGVHHKLTVPKTPDQNGVAEHLNRTLIGTVCSMLCESKLPQCFRAEAVSTAVCIRNQSPTKAVDGSTPIEAWTGKNRDWIIFTDSNVLHTLMYIRTKERSYV